MQYLHQHVHISECPDSSMSEIWDNLVGDAPYAAPGIVDVVADSPCIPDLGGPFTGVSANAPLADIVLYVTVYCL
jgi:hypothetical protein